MNKSPFENFITSPRKLLIVDFLIVVPFLVLPLFLKLPYRVNIFLTWEGAYRLYLGQTPFVDFGIPMGFGFWVIPAAFFKIFGTAFISLVKAQVFINFISIISLRGMLYNLKVKPIAITLSILIFCLTFVIYNFWPWYNHSVVVFELVAFFFLTSYDVDNGKWKNILFLVMAGFFTFFSFFTKQDVGGICLVICSFLLVYIFLLEKRIYPLIIYLISFFVVAIIFTVPFINHDFFYWFNYGQAPHSSRISISLLADILFIESLNEKIYILLLLGGIILTIPSWQYYFKDKHLFFITILSLGLILQSLVTRATSPLPTNHMNYYHTFGFIGIAYFLPWEKWNRNFLSIAMIAILLMACYSEGYWKYVSGLIPKKQKDLVEEKAAVKWTESSLPTMKRILLPEPTNKGIDNVLSLPFLKKENLKVLNMTELTSLAQEIGYTPITNQPLWYHLNIGIFQKQVNEINNLVKAKYYDLVLFEDIPSLNNFYPYEIVHELRKNYFYYDSFMAPRKLEDSHIDVFIRPDLATQFELKPKNNLSNLNPQ